MSELTLQACYPERIHFYFNDRSRVNSMIVTGGPPTTFEQLVEYFKLCREFADNSLYVWAYVTQLKIPLVYTKDFS